MPRARSKQIDLNVTPYYHCYVRCVRRGYLFGQDEKGNDYSHRKQWVKDRIKHLTDAFAIKICAYAVMNNHYHLVIYIDKDTAMSWDKPTVIQQWRKVASIEDQPSDAKIFACKEKLCNISWFMRFLNEYIARLANEEDDVTGRFWEGRFKSQALVDQGALLACMTYVDLNPIRAGQADSLELSDYTAIQARIEAHLAHEKKPEYLMGFQSPNTASTQSVLPFSFKDYITLIDWTGRQIRADKKGFIPADVPGIVAILGLKPERWMSTVTHYGSSYQTIAGTVESIKAWAQKINQSWLKGQKISRELYLSPG